MTANDRDAASAPVTLAGSSATFRHLLDDALAVLGELELTPVLYRIVEMATEVLGARYGALGVLGANRLHQQFLHVGISEADARRIGAPPAGHGVLGAVLQSDGVLKVDDIGHDPRSVGFPDEHPEMRSFLGVPIRVGDEVYGNLYLADATAGTFTDADTEILETLGAIAAIAIRNAHRYDEALQREHWSHSAAEITAALLGDHEEDALELIAVRVMENAHASFAAVLLPAANDQLHAAIVRGRASTDLEGSLVDHHATLPGRAHESAQPVVAGFSDGWRESTPQHARFGSTLAVPLLTGDSVTGVLVVAREIGEPSFDESEVDRAADFAAQASMALALSQARTDAQKLELIADRSRIARDLHDTVIQRLFGAGLSLQAAVARSNDPALRTVISEQISTLDAAIAEIRTAIFALTEPSPRSASLRHRVLDVISEYSRHFPVSPSVTFAGAIDLSVEPELHADVLAVVREGLSNVIKHAQASRCSVEVSALSDDVVVTIVDDGVGVPDQFDRASGTANLHQRATARGGTSGLEPGVDRGSVLRWRVPLTTGPEAR